MSGKRPSTGAALVVGVLLMVSSSPLWAQDELKIAVIDVQKILTDSAAGKEILAALETLRQEKQQELEAKQTELEDARKRYDQTRLTLADDKIAEMEAHIEDMAIALRRANEQANRDMQKRQQEDFGRIEAEIMPIINEVGREFGYTMIFNKFQSGLVFADDSIDVTNLVIERFNASKASPGN